MDLQLYLTKMDIEEEKNPQENFAHLQSSQDVKMMKTLPGRVRLLFFIHNLKRILGVPSSTVNSEVYFDLRQLSIAKLVEDSTLKFLCKLKTYEMIFNILQSLLLLNSKWCNYCNTLL